METKRIQTSKWDIAYLQSKGTEGTVVFIHPNSSSKMIFEKQFDGDLAKRFRLVAPDLPGHGETLLISSEEADYGLSSLIEFLQEFCGGLDCDHAVFVGNSLGGHLLIQAIHKLNNPSGLVIFGTPPLSKPPLLEAAFLPHPVIPLVFQETLTQEEKEKWSHSCFVHKSNIPNFFLADLTSTDPKFRSAVGGILVSPDFRDEAAALSDLSIPVAVIHGQQDQLINLDYLNNVHTPTLWQKSVQVIPEAGHIPQWEQPQAFNELLVRFIEKNS